MEQIFFSNGDDDLLTSRSWTKREIIDPDEWIILPAKDLANRSRPLPPPSIANDLRLELGLFDTLEQILAPKRRTKTKTAKRAFERPISASTRKYIVSLTWLAFYTSISILSGAFSAYLFAHREFLMLPASVLAFVGFAVLALIRLSIHIQDHRLLSDEINLKKAA